MPLNKQTHYESNKNSRKFMMRKKPMLAYPVSSKPIDYTKPVFMQPKLDGVRCVIQYGDVSAEAQKLKLIHVPVKSGKILTTYYKV